MRSLTMRVLPVLIMFISLPLAKGQAPSAGELFIPLEIQKAYQNGTRSSDGKPGPKYWQNHSSYRIKVQVDPAGLTLTGEEEVTYSNNSPDDLRQIVVHLMYDLYKKGNARDESIAPEEITGGVDLKRVAINGQTIDLMDRGQVRRMGTNLYLRLDEPLGPNETLTFSAEWSESIPPAGIRVGRYDSLSYFVGYWYPQIAVYDDIDGWDSYSYTGRTEFYSDLADFDVQITVPDSFLVYATGVLQNAAEVLPAEVHRKFEEAKTSDETVTLINSGMADAGFRMKGTTWHYQASGVPDFAFFTSDHFVWESTSLAVGDRRVSISTLYPTSNAAPYDGVTQMQRKIMDFFSTRITGIPYPYPAYASINAGFGGGMEFPMMANNAAPETLESMTNLTAHEMHHMYLPFYVRINEKKYAWMDEGWADYITDLALRDILGEEYWTSALGNLKFLTQGIFGTMANVPLITVSEYTGDENYGFTTYMYAHLTYMLLHDILGEETFVKCMREYLRRWAGKSPTPYDYFFTFEDVSGQDLSWFWKPWYFEYGYPDLAIESVSKNRVTVRKAGSRPVPVDLRITYEDGSTEELHEGAAVWKDGQSSLTLKAGSKKPIRKIVLNPSIPDADEMSNIFFPAGTGISPKDLVAYAGLYAVNPSISIEVAAEEDHLRVKVPLANLDAVLYPDGDNKFATIGEDFKLEFGRDEEGKVAGVMVAVLGQTIPARKVQ